MSFLVPSKISPSIAQQSLEEQKRSNDLFNDFNLSMEKLAKISVEQLEIAKRNENTAQLQKDAAAFKDKISKRRFWIGIVIAVLSFLVAVFSQVSNSQLQDIQFDNAQAEAKLLEDISLKLEKLEGSSTDSVSILESIKHEFEQHQATQSQEN